MWAPTFIIYVSHMKQFVKGIVQVLEHKLSHI